MQPRDIIVIGGSAGALAPLSTIVRGLPARLPAAIFVVIHTAPDHPGMLARILSRAGSLPAVTADDGAIIRAGHIHVAMPDHHLLITPGSVRVTRGPREHRFRPAVDPLFRTAATAYGPRVVGIILSGGQYHGALGLSYVKTRGGVTIVQDPNDAEARSMPESAIRQTSVDHILCADDMPAIISGLVGEGSKKHAASWPRTRTVSATTHATEP